MSSRCSTKRRGTRRGSEAVEEMMGAILFTAHAQVPARAVKYVLDINTVSFLMRGHPPVVSRLTGQRRTDVYLPQPVLAELEYGFREDAAVGSPPPPSTTSRPPPGSRPSGLVG